MADFKHLIALTDNNGILQFSQRDWPDPNSGYTLDDNARALLVSIFSADRQEWAQCYASSLYRSQRPDGSWSNFQLGSRFSSGFDSEDSVGRALLACCIGTAGNWPELRKLCLDMLNRNLLRAFDFTSPRAIAYTLLGLCKGEVPIAPERLLSIISSLSNRLIGLYKAKHHHDWLWFEDYFTYCNGILPQALLAAYTVNGDKKALKTGHDSLNFLNSILFRDGFLNIIGNQGWYRKGEPIALFDQQPVDAASTYFACMEAYQTMGSQEYRELARAAHAWFRGQNIHKLSLYNPKTGGCFDAITAEGLNLNQGAESTLSLLLCDLHAEGSMELQAESGSGS